MTLKNLKKQKETLENQLNNLQLIHNEPDKYYQERLNIELKLIRVESLIQYEKNLLPFKYTIWIACAVMAIGLSIVIIKATWK